MSFPLPGMVLNLVLGLILVFSSLWPPLYLAEEQMIGPSYLMHDVELGQREAYSTFQSRTFHCSPF